MRKRRGRRKVILQANRKELAKREGSSFGVSVVRIWVASSAPLDLRSWKSKKVSEDLSASESEESIG